MKPFYDRVVELLEEGKTFVVAHLVEAQGSTPQQPGAKLLVHPEGETEFTLGGGALEAHVAREALRPEVRNSIRRYALGELGMYCGGSVKVLYEPLGSKGAKALAFYRRVRELSDGERLVLIHVVSEGSGPPASAQILLRGNGRVQSVLGEGLPSGLLEAISEEALSILTPASRTRKGKRTALKEYPLGETSAWAFFEFVQGLPRLLIFGAGHVGAKLVELAAATGLFQIEVVDERAEPLEGLQSLNLVSRTHQADQGYGDLPLLPDERSFVVIVTRSHETDLAILRAIMRSGRRPFYLGMIGSRRKREELFRRLAAEGVPRERLEEVHIPIGLPLGGKEPGEIAVSILAEMIKVKNMGG